MFYRVIQKGLDYWNSAFFCGSAAVLAAHFPHAERRYFGRNHHGGRRDRAVPACPGLQQRLYREAHDRRAFSRNSQRFYRPAYPLGPRHDADLSLEESLLIRGLTLPQRLCYFSSCFFWFFAYTRVVFMLAPLCFLFFGLKDLQRELCGFRGLLSAASFRGVHGVGLSFRPCALVVRLGAL